jgi:hypothetical protein
MSDLKDAVRADHLNYGLNYLFVKDRFGNTESAVYFSNGFLQAPFDTYFSNSFTVTLWINLKSFKNIISIIDFANATSSNSVSLGLRKNSKFVLTFAQDSTSLTLTSEDCFLNLDVWNFLAFSVQGSTGSLYLNGIQININSTLVSTSKAFSGSNFIGKSNSPAELANLDAVMDDLKIYEGTLSSLNIYNEFIKSKIGSLKFIYIYLFI